MEKGVLVPGIGMLGTDNAMISQAKGILLPHNWECSCQARGCLSHARASF